MSWALEDDLIKSRKRAFFSKCTFRTKEIHSHEFREGMQYVLIPPNIIRWEEYNWDLNLKWPRNIKSWKFLNNEYIEYPGSDRMEAQGKNKIYKNFILHSSVCDGDIHFYFNNIQPSPGVLVIILWWKQMKDLFKSVIAFLWFSWIWYFTFYMSDNTVLFPWVIKIMDLIFNWILTSFWLLSV